MQQRAPPPPSLDSKPAGAAPLDELTAARAALTAALAAHTQAELDHKRAKRSLAKLQPPKFSGEKASHLEINDELFAAICDAEMIGLKDRQCAKGSCFGHQKC